MIDDLKLAPGVRERLEKQLLEAFGKPELERLASRVGIDLSHIAEGPLREDVTRFLEEVGRLGLGRDLIRMARRANPTHPGLNEVLATLLPRVFKPNQVAELVRILQEAGLPWSLLEQHFWPSILPISWPGSFAQIQEERERVEELVDVLADFPDRNQLGRASPLFEFVLRLCKGLEAGSVAERLMQWLDSTALALNKDLNRIKEQGYQLLGELYLMVKLERVTVEGFRVEAWLADKRSRYPRAIYQEERSWKLEEVSQALRQIWRRRELAEPLKQLGESKLTVEFLLPRELLLHAVEDWRVLQGAPIGARYQVVVRSLERAYAEVRPPLEPELEDLLLASTPWNEKWRFFSSSPESPCRPVWIRKAADHQDNNGFLLDLASPDVVCLALTMKSPALTEKTLRELIHHCLVSGMPMALWVREPECGDEEIQTLFNGLMKDLSKLPGAVRDARREGFKSNKTGHLGNQLTLVWDDPNRLPEDARPGSDYSAPGHMGVTG